MIRTLIPKPIRKKLARVVLPKSPVLWANWGPLSEYLAKAIPPKQPPVVILSLPRSGSSWVGETLSLAPDAMYLREPINQAFLKKNPDKPSDFEFSLMNPPDAYVEAATTVFSALPTFSPSIVPNTRQWSLIGRKSKRLIVKEVNPFMIEWVTQVFHPKIIYLLRHPVAVTDSFVRHGWSGKKFESRLSKNTLESKVPYYQQFTHSFWSEHGAFQAFLLNEVLESTKNYNDIMITKYEDLCADPLNEYKKLYDFSQLKWNDSIEQAILKRCNPEKVNDDFYSTQRIASYEMSKWRKTVAPDKILELKQAYLSLKPSYYADDWPE